MNPTRTLIVLLAAATLSCSKPAEDDSAYEGPLFSENIRTTPALTPEQEQASFKLPPGFEIEVFASEPDIQKPMNLAFDAKGRLWVTQSFDYPFPAEPGNGTDHITILEDTDHDGKADKFTNFSDSLNIPIGLYPVSDGALAFSIPNVYRFTDSNGDLKADQARIMLGPFGYVDTHGMVSNFYRGYDGWIHACHGFTNDSRIAGTDHDSIHMVSGNTFRFRLDGSRVEQTTFGQVNPFGLAYDDRGYVYSTDSHSSPLYQLVTAGDYPHFGKIEIMAFCPDMKPLVQEGTALCGITYYSDSHWPAEFRDNLFIGDVLNSRVHRYSYVNKGSSPVGKSEDDFIKTKDPWFRPVNIKLGPDGALYVADFYNVIIGHYEVPLGHPMRDKNRGRIWRITYKGNTHSVDDLTKLSQDELIAKLDHDNLPVRMSATDEITDRLGASAIPALQQKIATATPRQKVHLLWALQRLKGLTPEAIQQAATDTAALVRLHLQRILKEEPTSEASQQLAITASADKDPHVRRAAIEVLGDYRNKATLSALMATLHQTPAEDTHLIYTCRLWLRNLLRDESQMKDVLAAKWTPEEITWIEGTLVDVNSVPAAQFLAHNIDNNPLPSAKMGLAYQQIARYLPQQDLGSVVEHVMENSNRSIDERAAIFRGIRQGVAARGAKENAKFQQWGASIAADLFRKYPPVDSAVSDEVADMQRLACDLAGAYKVKALVPVLGNFLTTTGSSRNDVKGTAFNALLQIEPTSTIALAGKVIMNDSVSLDFRRKVATALSTYPGSAVNKVLSQVKNVPPDLEIAVATSLASSVEGKAILFRKIKTGEMAARTLRNPRVQDRLLLNITSADRATYDELTANLTEISKEKDQLIEARVKAFRSAGKLSQAQLDSGAILFSSNCGICHRRVSRDAIGPPLAGIGKRGDQALAEKILDPNRNITEAFRNYTVKTRDGKVFSGVYRRDEGALAIYADLNGTEVSIPKKDIVEKKASPFTVMPDTFGNTLTQRQFNELLAYLLDY